MLVYGDPQFTVSARTFSNQLKGRIQRADLGNRDSTRALLIQAGQFEQALYDLSEGGTPQRESDLNAAIRLTDAAAQALFGGKVPTSEMQRHLEALERLEDVALRIKIPEGYEFYALFPEQYFETARRWARETAPEGKVLVIGIRSIGTSLSATVCAALEQEHMECERFTVRPMGHPFQRHAMLKKLEPARWGSVIIVDEGPGLSGSSVSALCKALEAQGFDPAKFNIFPGHDGEPGHSSSSDVRRWWSKTPRWFTPFGNLHERLLEHSAKLVPDWSGQATVEDASAGRWRGLSGLPAENWPPAMIPFERPKYRCSSKRGKVLWKFVGLGAAYEPGRTGAELAMLKMDAVAKKGFGPPPLGVFEGFVAMPWIEGAPLRTEEARQPELFERLCDYTLRFAGSPLSPDEIIEAQHRLATMLETNTREALGDEWAEVAKKRAQEERELKVLQSYGDGHLAPYEWLRDARAQILKTDCFGHDIDHTCIGKQSLLWDVAGLAIEWGVPKQQIAGLMDVFDRQGVCVEDRVLQFYQIAYAAFRTGQSALCADSVTDEEDKRRLQVARKRYCHVLLQLLS